MFQRCSCSRPIGAVGQTTSSFCIFPLLPEILDIQKFGYAPVLRHHGGKTGRNSNHERLLLRPVFPPFCDYACAVFNLLGCVGLDDLPTVSQKCVQPSCNRLVAPAQNCTWHSASHLLSFFCVPFRLVRPCCCDRSCLYFSGLSYEAASSDGFQDVFCSSRCLIVHSNPFFAHTNCCFGVFLFWWQAISWRHPFVVYWAVLQW